MPILAGDIKLVASQIMNDVPEGGGAPTNVLIIDGASNAIFPDISELDRAGGRVNVLKLHVSVQSTDTATYLGSNVIVAEPPSDPNVSITLFTTNDTFDRRAVASSRIESYLNKGPGWPGILYENHIVGQRSIQILQRPETEKPPVGHTFALAQNEGLPNQIEQYVRSTEVAAVVRAFTDANGADYQMAVVTISISDALRYDLIGSPASKSLTALTTAAKVRDTVVADAGSYVGVVPTVATVAIGDFTVNAASVFTQLVPSAQTESPISDVRTNGLSVALVPTGNAVTQSITLGFTTAQNLFVGGPIYPGSLSIVRAGVTLVDTGGLLKNAGVEVGQVDYDNGIVSLSTNVWGASGGSHQVTFIPAASPELISDSHQIKITQETRSLSYAFTMGEIPLPRTLTLSYLVQGRWYVLRDNGAGVLAGASNNGVGTLSYSTGSVSVTLGALPDVGSSIIVQSYSKTTTVQASNSFLANSGKLFVPLNMDGLVSSEKSTKAIGRSSLTVSWNDGTPRSATETGTGVLTGDATGTVDYAGGVVRISPNALPAPGTVFTLGAGAHLSSVATGVALAGGALGATGITPGSVSCVVDIVITYAAAPGFMVTKETRGRGAYITDDGAGNLRMSFGLSAEVANCGTINYTTGVLSYVAPTLAKPDPYGPQTAATVGAVSWWYMLPWDAQPGTRTLTCQANANVTYSAVGASADSVLIAVNNYFVSAALVPNYTLKAVGFTLGGTRYQELTDGTLVKDINPLVGGGTPAGSVVGATGMVSLLSWPAGASPTLVDWRGVISPPSVGLAAPFTDFGSIFRVAASPLRVGSVSVLGTMQDGTTFNVTSDNSGKINGPRVKGLVDYQYGLVQLFFVNPAGDPALTIDLSSLGITGLTTIPRDLVMLNSIRYNAVAYSYLPLDANILGLDPVRLPSDGRVPIFRAGGFAVLGNTQKITATVSNAQVINCARVRLSRVRVLGTDGAIINTGYTTDLEAGTVTFTNVTGYSQPVTVEHRVEDMAVVRDVQINGQVTFTRAVTHAYPVTVPPTSFLSSALVAGDLKSRVSVLFDQQTWANTWLDTAVGGSATATFNDVASPLVVTNTGALTERWALVFTNSTTFNVIGEHVGVIATGNTGTDLSPVNPTTGLPYFTVPALGFGAGWTAGNVIRFNTVGAMAPVWVVRTVQQGPNTGLQHSFTLLSRGDVDRP